MTHPRTPRSPRPNRQAVVRAFEPGDAEALARMMQQASIIADTCRTPHESVATNTTRLLAEDPQRRSLVATLDERVVGSISVHFEGAGRHRHRASIGMMVDEALQARGIGSALPYPRLTAEEAASRPPPALPRAPKAAPSPEGRQRPRARLGTARRASVSVGGTRTEPRALARWLACGVSTVLALLAPTACEEPRSTSGATLIAGPVVQPPTSASEPSTLVSAAAVTPPSAASRVENTPDAVRAAWLAGPLIGRDNGMAHHREARITARADGTYELYVKNQFGFRCTLSFGPDGRPALFERCRSNQAGWRAIPASLPVTCSITGAEEACEGPFRLLYPSSGGSPAALRIVRALSP